VRHLDETTRSRARLWTGVVGSTLVLLGGLVVATVPASSWVDGIAPRHTFAGRVTGLLVVVLGLTAATLAWLALWRAARRGDLDLGTVRRSCAAWCAPLLLAPPLFSRDGWSYAAQGQLTHLGLSPYVWAPGILRGPIVEAVDPRWMQTPTPYGPLPLVWGAGAASITDSPWLLVVAHRLLALAGLALLAWALPRLARWSGRDPVFVSALVLPCPLVLAHGVGGLHNDLLMAGLAAAALVAGARHGWPAGAALGGLAAAVKLPGGLVCLAVALVSLPAAATAGRRLGRLLAVGGVGVATLVGVGVAAGLGIGWVHALGVPGSVTTPLSLTARLDAVVPHARVGGSLLVLGLVAWLALRGCTGSRAAGLDAAAAVLTATVLLGPVVHPWYALWCLPLLAAGRLPRRWLSVTIWCAVALGLSAPLDSELVGAATAAAITTGVVVAVVAALTWSLRPSALAEEPPAREPARV
jgi:alpha-1,6-mannosyltransferase